MRRGLPGVAAALASSLLAACDAGTEPARVPPAAAGPPPSVAVLVPEDPILAAVGDVRLGMRLTEVQARRPTLSGHVESVAWTDTIAAREVRFVRHQARTSLEWMREAAGLGQMPLEMQVLDAVEYTWGATEPVVFRVAAEPRDALRRRLAAELSRRQAARGEPARCVRVTGPGGGKNTAGDGSGVALLFWRAGASFAGFRILPGPRDGWAVVAFLSADSTEFRSGPRFPLITRRDQYLSMREMLIDAGAPEEGIARLLREAEDDLARHPDEVDSTYAAMHARSVRQLIPTSCARVLDGL